MPFDLNDKTKFYVEPPSYSYCVWKVLREPVTISLLSVLLTLAALLLILEV